MRVEDWCISVSQAAWQKPLLLSPPFSRTDVQTTREIAHEGFDESLAAKCSDREYSGTFEFPTKDGQARNSLREVRDCVCAHGSLPQCVIAGPGRKLGSGCHRTDHQVWNGQPPEPVVATFSTPECLAFEMCDTLTRVGHLGRSAQGFARRRRTHTHTRRREPLASGIYS